MLLSKAIVSRLNPKCYLGVTSTRLFSTVRKQPRGFEPKLFQTSHQLNIRSSHIRLLSVTGPKLSENNKEELIFEIPEKPVEPEVKPVVEQAPDSQELVFTIPEKPAEPIVEAAPDSQELVFTIPEKPAEPIVEAAPDSQELVFTIPEKPDPVDPTLLGEPSLESLGLASYWPSGRLQCSLEWVS